MLCACVLVYFFDNIDGEELLRCQMVRHIEPKVRLVRREKRDFRQALLGWKLPNHTVELSQDVGLARLRKALLLKACASRKQTSEAKNRQLQIIAGDGLGEPIEDDSLRIMVDKEPEKLLACVSRR
jgi:hypothetical protein